MLSKTYSASLSGLNCSLVEVEVNLSRGRPCFIIIGLPSRTLDEAKERISAALQECEIRIKSQKTVVNLAPADIRKNSSALELAIAVGLMQSYRLFNFDLSKTLILGELSLDGSLRAIRGALPIVLAAKNLGFERVIFPQANLTEVQVVDGIELCAVKSLQQLYSFLKRGDLPCFPPVKYQVDSGNFGWNLAGVPDFDSIIGQEQAKRALAIAAAGGHNILLIGPPGSGKSLMARAMVGILPSLTLEESIAVTQIYSVHSGTPDGLVKVRPFRSPHHTISSPGLIGGGTQLSPGEISLAHKGVLFLDEFPEFAKNCLEALRQPLEDGQIRISRAMSSTDYPAEFSLVAAANPCPCGFKGTLVKNCVCGPSALENYNKKFSGPILDRIDLVVRVQAVEIDKLTRKVSSGAMSSAQIGQQVSLARDLQLKRFENASFKLNSRVSSSEIFSYFNLSDSALKLLSLAADKFSLSARSYFKMIKVAGTIADLDGKDVVGEMQVSEALVYR